MKTTYETMSDLTLQNAGKSRYKRDKSENTKEFNRIVRERRVKAKAAKKSRKKNRK